MATFPPTDELLDVPPVPDGRLWLRVAGQVAATGALAGGLEAMGLALSVRLPLTTGEMCVLAGLAVLANLTVGAMGGLAGGAIGQLLLRRLPRWKRYRGGFTAGVLLIAGFFLLPMTRELWLRDQRAASAGMVGLLASVGVMTWFNAGYWYRRELLGAAPRLGWKGAAGSVTILLVLFALVVRREERKNLVPPPPDAPNVVLITIDTLRRDHVGAYGSVVSTPVMDRLAAEGALFEQAITSVPETEPAHAAMFTGLPPVQTGIVQNGIVMSRGLFTVAEHFALTGWRTGAFVSSYAVDSFTGLDQGFDVYDDDFLPALRGLSEVRAARLGLRALMRFGDPTDYPSLLERPAPDTIARALAWAGSGTRPSFLWVHLFEPHSPYERHDGQPEEVDHREILAQEPGYAYTEEEEAALRDLYRQEVEYVDRQVGELLDGLRARGKLDNALVLLVADHGESLGEHDIRFNHHGLYDEVLRVPLLLWSSAPAWEPGARVTRQVTVEDVANTLVEASGLTRLSRTDSLPLTTHLVGMEVPARPVLLLGRLGMSTREGRLYGVRDPRGVKYLQSADGQKEELYDLTEDPGELRNIAAAQPEAVQQGRTNVTIVRERAPTKPLAENEMLEALGYTSD